MFVSEHMIPAGSYRSHSDAKPAEDIEAVALPGQLLTRKGLPPHLIQAVTRMVLDKHFARQNDLPELLEGGKEFAEAKPEFPIHVGAQSVYDPDFDIKVVESWEAVYSLSVSVFIAVFFACSGAEKAEGGKEGAQAGYIH